MKRILAVFALANLLWLTGCADEQEAMTAQEVGQKFQRGIQGEGRLAPLDRSDDPYVQERAPQTHP